MNSTKIFTEGDYKIVNNYDMQISTLYKNEAVIHQFTCGKKFTVWYRNQNILFYDLILVTHFNDDTNTTNNLYHVKNGLVFSKDPVWIDHWPWNDFIIIKLEENQIGAIDKNINWVVPPIHKNSEATDAYDTMPNLTFYKNGQQYELLRNGVFFNYPSKVHHNYTLEHQYIIVEEVNEEGCSRLCFSEDGDEIINPKTYKSDFSYKNVVSDNYDDWITATHDGVEIFRHTDKWLASVVPPK